ncbi:hypothetical protein [Eubacterium callanderi]
MLQISKSVKKTVEMFESFNELIRDTSKVNVVYGDCGKHFERV